MASSVIAASGKTLGSRHNSYNNLVRSNSITEWISSSNDNTPKAHLGASNISKEALSRQDSFASLSDGFDMVSPPPLSWSNTVESKLGSIGSLGNADDYLSNLAEHSIDLKTSFTETLHVDDFFRDTNSVESSPFTGPTINLPGWNNGPDFFGGLSDSEIDSPEGIWYGHTQQPLKAVRSKGPKPPSFMLSIDSEFIGSPGASNIIDIDQASSPLFESGCNSLLAPARSLRSSISAPHLQRDDPVLQAAGTQQSINDFLIDAGYPQERIPQNGNALGLEMVHAKTHGEPEQDASSHRSNSSSSQGVSAMMNMSASSSTSAAASPSMSVAQSSALFQRRANQRDGNLNAPSPVAVSNAGAETATAASGDQTFEVGPGRTVTLNDPTDSSINPEDMTEEQRMRLVQLHQIHVAQQAARLGVYQDFVTPSQQFAGQEASERAAKAVQAALMYGMEGNSPRKLSAGSTGLPTPITPQHPLAPGPSAGGLMDAANYSFHPMPMQAFGPNGFDPRIPGMPLSAGASQFGPSIQQQFANLHMAHVDQQQHLQQPQQQQQHAHVSGQQQHQQIFTPQFLHQNDATLYVGQAAAPQDMSGYTSVYPPPRHNSFSSVPENRSGMLGLTLTANGLVADPRMEGLMPPRRASHIPLRTTESSPSLASQIAANPMQLQNPFVSLQAQQQAARNAIEPTTLEPSKLMASSMTSGLSVVVPPAASTPRSAPADAGKEALALQQARVRQMQQQQQQFLQMQQPGANNNNNNNNNKQASTSKVMLGITTKKMPANLSAPLSPPRSPQKMKSTPHLRSPLSMSGSLPPLPGSPNKQIAPSLRKIASNRRINTVGGGGSNNSNSGGASTTTTSSSCSSSSTSAGSSTPNLNKAAKGFTLELTTSASPGRSRTISHQSTTSSRSSSALGTSKSPTPTASSSGAGPSSSSVGGSGISLSFVNYGIDDADEICSAVAPSGSYKVPLRGFGDGGSGGSAEASSGEEYDDEEELGGGSRAGGGGGRSRTTTNTSSMLDSDDDTSVNSPSSFVPSSPTKKVRKNSSRPNLLRSGSASPLKAKKSLANLSSSASTSRFVATTTPNDPNRSPRKMKSSILSPAPATFNYE